MIVAVAALALSAFSAMIIPALGVSGRWLVGLLVVFIVMPVSLAVVPNRMCRPYRLRVVDGDRGVYRFRASKRAYTELLIDQVRRSNGDV
jgi:hypothetical protein